MNHDTMYSKSEVIKEIAKRTGKSPHQVVLRWIHQKGVVAVFGSSVPEQQIENLKSLDGPDLSPEDMVKINALDINRPLFYDLRGPELTVKKQIFE